MTDSVGFIKRGLAHRALRVEACLKKGEPPWERIKPPGYDRMQERCARCKVLRKQHSSTAET